MPFDNIRSGYLPVQKVAAAVGAVFLLAGILGFVPGITTNYSSLSWAGHESGALLLGVFAVSVLHNVVHLAFGVAGVLMSRTPRAARNFLVGGGIVYAVLWLYGVVTTDNSSADFVPLNTGDNWLHIVLAIGMITMGVALTREVSERPTEGGRGTLPHAG